MAITFIAGANAGPGQLTAITSANMTENTHSRAAIVLNSHVPIFSCAVRPKARAISRLPAGVSDEAMKSRICSRVGKPGERFGLGICQR